MNRNRHFSDRSVRWLIRTISLSIFIFIISLSALPRAVSAATASIGANAYYMAWQPPWADGTNYFVPYYFTFMKDPSTLTPAQLYGYRNSVKFRINRFKPIHGPMAGPSLSVSFADRWSISSVFLAGRFIANSSGHVEKGVTDRMAPYLGSTETVFLLTSHYHRIIIRYDSDTTLSCAPHRYVRLFAGFKYQGYEYDESMNYFSSNGGGLRGAGEARFHGFGGGLGFGFSLPLAPGLYASLNLSGLCMYGIASYDFSQQFVYTLSGYITPIFTQFGNERYWSAGGNSTLSLSYLFERAGVSLSLGFRYQVLYYFWQKSTDSGFLDYTGRYDHSYGGTFSIIYSFGGKKA